jgi:cell division transport system permease protein
MIGWLHPRAADRRIIGGSALRSITPWIVAVMSFTILLVAASGLIVTGAASTLERSISNRYSLEVPGEADVEALAARMRGLPGIASAEPVSEAEMRRTLENWLGSAAGSPDLPVPALVEFDLVPGADAAAVRRSLARLAPTGEVVAHGDSVAPLLGSLRLLQWVALALVILLGLAASAAVVLAARGAMDTNRQTVEVLHGIGATDAQISRLFQRRIALDTLIGALGGALLAGLVMAIAAAGAWWAGEMAGLRLRPSDFVVLALLPLALTAAATLAARTAIHSILAREP